MAVGKYPGVLSPWCFTGMQLYSSSKINVCFSLIGKTSMSNLGHIAFLLVHLKNNIKEKENRYIFFHLNSRRVILDDPPGVETL